jgi:hypothetical protein
MEYFKPAHGRLRVLAAVLLALLIPTFLACEGPLHPNYFDTPELDPFPGGATPPSIETVTPDRGFAGDEAVISGGPFPTDKKRVMVNVGVRAAEILELTESEITIRLPLNASGDQRVRVSVWGAETWSNALTYAYLSDFVRIDAGIANPGGVAVDDEGNLYISSTSAAAIYRIDLADSVRTTYASLPVTGPMEFGPNGNLYVVTSAGLSRVTPGGTVEVVTAVSGLMDFDWDENGNIYLLRGPQILLYAGGTQTPVAAVTQGQRIRVFDGHVYVTELTRSRVARFAIQGDTLGPLEINFFGGTALKGLDIDRNGTLYASAYIRDYIMKAEQGREDDSDIEEIPDAAQRANPFRRISTRIGEVYIHNSVMYVVPDVAASGTEGSVWRIFIDERNAPRYGRD